MKRRNWLSLLKNFKRAGEVVECMKCTTQWYDLTLGYLGLKELFFPFTFATRKGQKIVVRTFHDLVTVWVIFCRHEYKIPKHAKVVVDAGANIGVFSIYASGHQVQEIFALEPFPETFAHLKENIETNDLTDKVKLKSIALASETGTRNMDLNVGPSQSRGLLSANDQGGLKVSTSTLADFLSSIEKKEVDFLKMDIEGGEHEVFHSTPAETLRRFQHIAMEYHPGAPKDALFAKIQQAQFELTHDFIISSASGVAYFKRTDLL